MADAIVSTADGRIKVVPFGSEALAPMVGQVSASALAAANSAQEAADQIPLVEAAGAAKVALAAAEKTAAQTARTGAEAARDQSLTARDTIGAAAGLAPTRAAATPTLFFSQSGGSYVDLPDYTNQPGTAAVDWYILVEAVAGAQAGAGTIEFLLSTPTGGNARSLTMPQFGASSNKRIPQQNIGLGGIQFVRNATARGGAASLFLRPLESFALVVASINGIPHWAGIREDGTQFAIKGDTNHFAGAGWFFVTATLSVTVARVANELQIVATTGTPFTSWLVGESIYVPGVGARVITSKISGSSIRCADPGVDASGLATSVYGPNTSYRTLLRMFNRAGADSTGVNSWLGGITRMMTRWGTTNLPGEFAAEMVDGDGFIKQSWLKAIIDGTYKTLPGSDRATLNFGAATIGTGAAFAGGSPAAQPTITGTTRKGAPVDQPSWLRLAPGQAPHNLVHAQELGQSFGSVRMTFQSDAMPYGAVATVYDRDPREAGATVVMTARPIFSPADQDDATAIIGTVHKVPANAGYWMRVALAQAGPEGTANSNYYTDFPCPVGFVQADLQQSLTGAALVIFSGGYVGNAISSGLATVAGSWNGGSSSANVTVGVPNAATLVKSAGYSTKARIASNATWANQYIEWANILLNGAQATYGRQGAAMFIPMVRNGHNLNDFVNDGETASQVIGPVAANVSFTMASLDPFGAVGVRWSEPGTVTIKANGSLICADNYAARSGATTGYTNGVAGTWNYDNWQASTITLPYAATIEVEMRSRNTGQEGNGATRLNYGAAVTGDDYSYVGIDGVAQSGSILDTINQTKSVSAVRDTWVYWALSSLSGLSLSAARTLLRSTHGKARARLLRYPQFSNLRTGEAVPFLIGPEQRHTANNVNNLHLARYVMEEMANELDGYAFLPGCLTNQGDAANFSHPDALGALHIMQQMALSQGSAAGIVTGDHHKIVRVIGGVRLSANSIRLYITPTPYGIGQHDAAATTFAGLWYSATEDFTAPAYVDTSAWTYTVNNSPTNPYIDLDKGSALAGGYFDINRGPAIPSTAGTKAAQDVLLTKTLCVLNGGYHASLNRRGDDVHYSNTIAGILIA